MFAPLKLTTTDNHYNYSEKGHISIYQRLQVSKCMKCGKVIAKLKELIRKK